MRGLTWSVGLVQDDRGGLQQILVGKRELTPCQGNSACQVVSGWN